MSTPNFASRKFSIVIHNVNEDIKPFVENFCKSQPCKTYVCSVEPYPSQDGFHLHLFFEFTQIKKSGVFFTWHRQNFKTIVCPKPPDKDGEWGRIQVDKMRGSFAQATKYLIDPNKDKPLGNDVKLVELDRQRRLDNYHWALGHMIRMYVSQFTGEWSTGRSLIKEYKSKDLKLPTFWENVENIYENGPPI